MSSYINKQRRNYGQLLAVDQQLPLLGMFEQVDVETGPLPELALVQGVSPQPRWVCVLLHFISLQGRAWIWQYFWVNKDSVGKSYISVLSF